jgi:hypothetical protein
MGNRVTKTHNVLRGIQRNDYGSRAGRRQKSHAEMVIVRHQQGDAGTGLDSGVMDEPAQGARPVDQFAKCDGFRRRIGYSLQREIARPCGGMPFQLIEKIEGQGQVLRLAGPQATYWRFSPGRTFLAFYFACSGLCV